MEKKVYIHYGHNEYDPDMFNEIINEMFTKPSGGLWASELDDEYS